MKAWMMALCVFVSITTWAQQATKEQSQPVENFTLRQRFGLMKEKSQTFKDYKVIKETTLDGVWRIVQDSIKAKDMALTESKTEVKKLKGAMQQMDSVVKAKEASVADIVYDSTHINVLGLNFGKGFFLTSVFTLVAGVIAFAVFVLGRSRLVNNALQEKKLALNMITHEFDEYKKRAMEKQMKLSRELQDERNKLQSMRNS